MLMLYSIGEKKSDPDKSVFIHVCCFVFCVTCYLMQINPRSVFHFMSLVTTLSHSHVVCCVCFFFALPINRYIPHENRVVFVQRWTQRENYCFRSAKFFVFFVSYSLSHSRYREHGCWCVLHFSCWDLFICLLMVVIRFFFLVYINEN